MVSEAGEMEDAAPHLSIQKELLLRVQKKSSILVHIHSLMVDQGQQSFLVSVSAAQPFSRGKFWELTRGRLRCYYVRGFMMFFGDPSYDDTKWRIMWMNEETFSTVVVVVPRNPSSGSSHDRPRHLIASTGR